MLFPIHIHTWPSCWSLSVLFLINDSKDIEVSPGQVLETACCVVVYQCFVKVARLWVWSLFFYGWEYNQRRSFMLIKPSCSPGRFNRALNSKITKITTLSWLENVHLEVWSLFLSFRSGYIFYHNTKKLPRTHVNCTNSCKCANSNVTSSLLAAVRWATAFLPLSVTLCVHVLFCFVHRFAKQLMRSWLNL